MTWVSTAACEPVLSVLVARTQYLPQPHSRVAHEIKIVEKSRFIVQFLVENYRLGGLDGFEVTEKSTAMPQCALDILALSRGDAKCV